MIAIGKHGYCSWKIDNNGILTIFPTNGIRGMLENQYKYNNTSPWSEYKDYILKVVVKKGVEADADISELFARLDKCKEMDLQGLNTLRVINMKFMFAGCRSLTSLNLNNFDIRNVRDMRKLFCNCCNLEVLNIESFKAPNLLWKNDMFRGCYKLKDVEDLEFRLPTKAETIEWQPRKKKANDSSVREISRV